MQVIRKKKSEKSKVIPVRPPPPTWDAIEADIQNADKDDYIFTSGLTLDEDESLESSWNEMLSTNDQEGMPDLKVFTKVEEQYGKILKFVKLHEELKSGLIELNKSTELLTKTRELIQEEKENLEKKLEMHQEMFKSSFENK